MEEQIWRCYSMPRELNKSLPTTSPSNWSRTFLNLKCVIMCAKTEPQKCTSSNMSHQLKLHADDFVSVVRADMPRSKP